MSRLAKQYAFRVGTAIGVDSLLRRGRKGAAVVYYHGIAPKITNPFVQSNQIPAAEFEHQIEHLRRQFEIISVQHLCESLAAGRRPRPDQVVITFDDGYRNNLTVAAPILRARGIPFCVFVSTEHILTGNRFPSYFLRAAVFANPSNRLRIDSLNLEWDIADRFRQRSAYRELAGIAKHLPLERLRQLMAELHSGIPADHWAELQQVFSSEDPMNWSEVVQLAALGGTVGSHCDYHCLLHPGQREDDIVFQLERSKAAIEDRIGPCRYFAFPNGMADDISAGAYHALGRLGYQLAFTTIGGEVVASCDRFLIPRVPAVKTFEAFQYRLMTAWRQQPAYEHACRTLRQLLSQ